MAILLIGKVWKGESKGHISGNMALPHTFPYLSNKEYSHAWKYNSFSPASALYYLTMPFAMGHMAKEIAIDMEMEREELMFAHVVFGAKKY